jgi:hypothetical protein
MANRRTSRGEIRIRKEFTSEQLHDNLDKLKRKLEFQRNKNVFQSEMIVELIMTHPKMKAL